MQCLDLDGEGNIWNMNWIFILGCILCDKPIYIGQFVWDSCADKEQFKWQTVTQTALKTWTNRRGQTINIPDKKRLKFYLFVISYGLVKLYILKCDTILELYFFEKKNTSIIVHMVMG
jgi:hypothetical protein